jgi:hypothetical protein
VEAIDRRTKAIITPIIDEIIDGGIKEIKDDKRFHDAIKVEMRELFRRLFRSHVEEETRKFAKEQCELLFKEFQLSIEGVIPKNQELEDPNSFNTKVGSVLLEETALKLTNQTA